MTARTVLRVTAILVSLGLVGLWIWFIRDISAQTRAIPSPGGVMMPIFFCGLAFGAILAAAKGEGIPVALAGGLSLVPMGLVLLFFPGPARLVPVLDLALIVIGVRLMRTDPDPDSGPEPSSVDGLS